MYIFLGFFSLLVGSRVGFNSRVISWHMGLSFRAWRYFLVVSLLASSCTFRSTAWLLFA